MPTVFITYSHKNSAHEGHHEAVKELGVKLRTEGLNVILDQFAQAEEFYQGGPSNPNGWGGWSYEQIGKADKVLIIGSDTYYRICKDEEKPGVGLGAAVEAHRIFSSLYSSKGHNERFRLVILNIGDDTGIPDWLSDHHRFYPRKSDQDFRNLVIWLMGDEAKEAQSALPIEPVITWPVAIPDYKPEIADRTKQFAFFVSMLSGATKERALLFEAPSNHGKTTLVLECIKYSNKVIGSDSTVTVDFKSDPSKEYALDTIKFELGKHLPAFSQANSQVKDLRADLRAIIKPTILIFDTYEKASSEARQMVEGQFLADLGKCPALRVVISGQAVPDFKKTLWSEIAQHFTLEPITDHNDWCSYTQQHYSHIEPSVVKALTTLTKGIPGPLRAMLQGLPPSQL